MPSPSSLHNLPDLVCLQVAFDLFSGDTAAEAGRIVYAEPQPESEVDKKKRTRMGKKPPVQETIPTIGGGASLIVIEQEGWDPSEPELPHRGGIPW